MALHRYWVPRLQTRGIVLDDAADTLRSLRARPSAADGGGCASRRVSPAGGSIPPRSWRLMQGVNSRPVQTFSVRFRTEINELPYGESCRPRYETEHHEVDLGAPPWRRCWSGWRQ